MKKLTVLFFCIITLIFQGCALNSPKYIQFNEHPTKNYYADEIENKIKNGDDFSLQVFDGNFYKYYDVTKDENDVFTNFLNSLTIDDFKDELNTNGKEEFKLIITFSDSKYIVKVFDKSTVTLYPWDGNYNEDIIDMSNIPMHYNLYDFCKHIDK